MSPFAGFLEDDGRQRRLRQRDIRELRLDHVALRLKFEAEVGWRITYTLKKKESSMATIVIFEFWRGLAGQGVYSSSVLMKMFISIQIFITGTSTIHSPSDKLTVFFLRILLDINNSPPPAYLFVRFSNFVTRIRQQKGKNK